MTKSKKGIGDIISVILVAVLFLVILMLVVFSAVSYQRSVSIRDMNANDRAVRSYITTAVKGNAGSSISVKSFDGGPALSIEDEESGYEQLIFAMDGKILETYTVSGEEPDVAEAIEIGETSGFELKLEDGLLEVVTDAGTSYVYLGN